MSSAKKISYALVPLLILASAWLNLGPTVIAGLLSYMILDLTYRKLAKHLPPMISKWLALGIFLVTAVALALMVARFIRSTIHTLPQIASTAIPKIIVLAESHGIDLPFDNVYEFREMAMQKIKEHAEGITHTSGVLTERFFHILIVVFVAILAFFSPPQDNDDENFFDELRSELRERMRLLMEGLAKVLGAQVLISAAYAIITLAFLMATGFTHVIFLTLATFLFGIMPVIGNIISNAIIVAAGLTLSTRHAVLALIFLIFIHKSGYFVYGRILGSSMKVPMWQTLLAILVGEVVMGVPGIILAPTLLHYAKEELRGLPTAALDQPINS